MIFMEGYARPLLILHGLLAGGVVGLLTHHALWVMKSQAHVPRIRHQARIFIRYGALATLLQLGLGLLIYPVYRVRVREALLDVMVNGLYPTRWVSSVFDLKEHLSSLLLALVVALVVSDRLQEVVREPRSAEAGATEEGGDPLKPLMWQLHQGFSVLAALIAWTVTALGLWVSSYHGLPTPGAGGGLP